MTVPSVDVRSPESTLGYAGDLDAFRRSVRAYLASDAELNRWQGQHYGTVEERVAETAVLVETLYTGQWNRYGWPEGVGGLGGDARHRAVLYDEMSAACLPVPDQQLVLETLAPALLFFSPELAATMIPAALRGEEWWAQGFSEPEAGSDLASLRCRARRDGADYVVSGQKLWTSNGATAKRLMCLVRTGTPESRHHGLTMLMIDADTPGVTVRPVALASGENELAEVFFDNAVVPGSRTVGDEGQGWAVTMFIMQYERAMYAWNRAAVMLRRFRELLGALRQRLDDGYGLPDGACRRLGDCYADIVTLRSRSAGTVRALASGQTVGPTASVDKILLSIAELSLHDTARELLGYEFLFDGSPQPTQWREDWWYSRSATILGGSAEMQRTILADHVLQLPKEVKL
jgi:alkylation response protein AidB-like acyl-CoA dehydrogenase